MWDTNSRNYNLGLKVSGRHLFDLVRNAVFNATNGKLKISSCIVGGEDVEMIYDLSLSRKDERKPTKEQLAFVVPFIMGLAEGSGQKTRLTGNGLPAKYAH